jgi:hypothetical protein
MEKLEIKLPFIGIGIKCCCRDCLVINISLSRLLTQLRPNTVVARYFSLLCVIYPLHIDFFVPYDLNRILQIVFITHSFSIRCMFVNLFMWSWLYVFFFFIQITSVQSLIGCTGRRWIMGVISQLEERQFYLEDLTGAVPIDLSNAIS